jgi:hypothetical protein
VAPRLASARRPPGSASVPIVGAGPAGLNAREPAGGYEVTVAEAPTIGAD